MKATAAALLFLPLTPTTGIRQLRPKTLKPTNQPTTNFIQADDILCPRTAPDDAPINANRGAYAARLNEEDLSVTESFVPDFVSDELHFDKGKHRIKGASLLALDGIDSVLITPEQMEDCDVNLMSLSRDASTCRQVGDTSMEGGGAEFTVLPNDAGLRGDDGEYEEEEMHGEEYYIQQLQLLLAEDADNVTFFGDMVESDGRRLNINTRGIGIFKPLQCNSGGLPTSAECEATPHGLMSDFVAAAGGKEVVIPCGQCIKYDLPQNTESTIQGLNIQGKLYIPPNYKTTLRTTHVFVQGELQMSDTNTISPDNQSVKIVLIGNSDVIFRPADSNALVRGTPFNAGSKPFLVAGGKLDIRGWDNNDTQVVSTWSPLLSMEEGPMPEPTLSDAKTLKEPIQPEDTTRVCQRQIINHDFDHSIDYSLWSGGEGAIVSHDQDAGTMVLTNLKKSHQGFRLDITKLLLDCPLNPNVDYLITARIKIDKDGHEGEDMPCKTGSDEWKDCPRLTRKVMRNVNNDMYNSQSLNKGTIGKYGEYFTISQVWQFNKERLSDDVIGTIFALENNEPGTVITLDSFIFELPSSKSFPDPDNVCSELVVNGDAENTDGNGWAFYPMFSSRSSSWEPTITDETLGNGSVNKFYRAANRKWHSDSIRFTMANGCFVRAMTYWISLRVRISSETPLSYYVQIKGPRADSGWTGKQPLKCPAISKEDGWVTCSGPYVIEDDLSDSVIVEDLHFEVIWDWRLDNGPVWTTVDYDDISMSFMAGVS